MLRALKKLPGFENYDKDGVQIFNTTIHFIDIAYKRASFLVSKQHDDPKEDPFSQESWRLRMVNIEPMD